METETERLTGGCRHKRKVGRKRELKMGAGAEEEGEKGRAAETNWKITAFYAPLQ